MLLKHLYDFAVSRNLLDDPAFRRNQPVRWIIHLDRTGKLLGNGPQQTEGPRKNKGHEYDVPKTSRATNSGTVADFLVDDIGAIFRLSGDPSEERNERAAAKLAAKHEDYWRQIVAARETTGDQRFDALLTFRASLSGAAPAFLVPDAKNTGWMVITSSGEEIPLGSDMLTFAVGTTLFLDDSIREHWRGVHAKETSDAEGAAVVGACIITGQTNVALARTHTPMVTGLPKPAKGTGAGVVGVESDAFRSYGFEKGYNAPTSIIASRAYLLALQFLSRNQNHWLPLGPAWLCFWAVESKDATDVFARLLRKPDPLTVRKFFTSPWAGLEKQPPASDKFIAVTLSAAGPRIVIKDWVQMPLIEAAEHFKNWFNDLTLENASDESSVADTGGEDEFAPLAVRRLAGCTAPLTKKGGRFIPDFDKLQPDVVTQLYRAALEGTAPSLSLLKPILNQLHSRLVRDDTYNLLYDESRFALLKLILNRQPNRSMKIQPTLTADTEDAAYNCGRLLAILAATQAKAHDFKLEGAGVSERYFGTASVSPSSVLPLLIRLNRHHLNKIRKSERFGGHERFIQEQIESVLVLFKPARTGLPPTFPRTLDFQAQGRFAIGFYQQHAADAAARQANKKDQTPALAPAS
ncbi:MAG: type I-C CRISPR-associated protein Cas8c/Csd1 [Opitutia bacterium Tous-C4FEB]|nr:MAG: type I-C CRISPR-associated protein Cas8c/Csd1 [Opitutae bacterium Tous-C5TDCM]PAW89573.1 MAG: type I-C CRISPR-associated protein Cas8c/Csd1 [Opitutae bacterium Tous-C4FEB]